MDSALKWITKISFCICSWLISSNTYSQQDSIKVIVNDSTEFWHKITWIQNDTLNGKCIAVFSSNKTTTAVIRNYKNGMKQGVWKQFYPSGHIMEKITYKNNKRNGEYLLVDFLGNIVIKGTYKNDIKNGNWEDRRYGISGRYKNGKKHGIWKWSADGFNYYLFKFSNGELVGDYRVQPPEVLLKN